MTVSSRVERPDLLITPTVEHQVEIVVDGGPCLGFGHVGRCLALWEELEGRAAFSARDASVVAFLDKRGVSTVAGSRAPVVLLDRAVPVAEAEVSELHREGRRVALLDDLGPARMIADAVVDPPTAASWPAAGGVRLGGFEHVLLRREVRAAALTSGGTRKGVLLALGGSDPLGLTPRLARLLAAAGIDLTVALGPGYRGPDPEVGNLLPTPEAFVPALAHTELLIAGYGHSLLEAAHLGVPAIALVYRPEQLPHARSFCDAGTALLLDLTAGESAHAEVAPLAVEILAAADRRAQMSIRGRALIDGRGAWRIARALAGLA